MTKLTYNVQNFPSGRVAGQSKALRTAIVAPAGYTLLGYDSAQGEIRCVDYIVGARRSLQNFRDGVCPYSSLAARMFGEGEAEQIKRDAKAGIAPWALRRQIAKSARIGCNYLIGPPKFKDYARTNAGLTISLEESKTYVYGFRNANPEVVRGWDQCEAVMHALIRGESGYFGGTSGELFYYDGQRTVLGVHLPGIRMPDGMWVSYPGIAAEQGKYGLDVYYIRKRGKSTYKSYVHKGTALENVTQALLACVMKYQATLLPYPLVLHTHDEHLCLVPDSEVDAAIPAIERAMSASPPWALDLPLEGEIKRGKNYGECK